MDIDPYDLNQVEWALSTRFQGDRDLVVIPGAYASRLDPSSDTESNLGCKLGIDATHSFRRPAEIFKKPDIPASERVKKLLDKLFWSTQKGRPAI
jgi:3-polyprenyl-4-hydroxybenzoate decarboxylase